ncbi:MAG TPA: hypothetical protein VFS76_25875 [Pyrinomonadaceae bacterium]|nr:hypothetical protein [Pyrinomonadaceae bacterium]
MAAITLTGKCKQTGETGVGEGRLETANNADIPIFHEFYDSSALRNRVSI